MLQNGPSLPPLFIRSCPACQCRVVDLSGDMYTVVPGYREGGEVGSPKQPLPSHGYEIATCWGQRAHDKHFGTGPYLIFSSSEGWNSKRGTVDCQMCHICHPCELSIILKLWGIQYQQVSVSVSVVSIVVVSIVVVSIIMVSNCPSLFLSCHLTLLLLGSCS